ncbi:MAG TPA: Stp1/IreP family PP2C-type Ser/Thr phosphatase [Ktedonobacteraceae bacterium]|nr:Stp1/IreP family PP2C-type Ser/Thr phosphatase [Ktedonobacteraceae bacterium]
MAKQLHLDVAQLTDVGRKREHNEDNMAYVIPKDPQVMAIKGALFIVADGMGGHAAGEVASEIAVDTVSNAYYQDDSDDVAFSLVQAIRRANAAIHQRAAENMLRSGMGTTCVAAVLRGNMAYIANVGDSRAYLVRSGQVRQISQDHSWVYEQVRAGLLTEDQARTHAQRNVITRSLGTQAEVEIDVFHEQLQEGDTLVLCSDGLSGLVSDEELQRTVEQFMPQESVYHLVERANENGGPDNITAIVVRVQEVGVEPPGVRHPVRIGGREIADAATIDQSPTLPPGSFMPYPSRNGDLANVGSPLQIISGPLASPDSLAAPQPALEKSRGVHNRLFYPALALLVIIVLALVAGGAYYFLRPNSAQTVNSSLTNAQHLIANAQAEIASNPSQALADLASAQKSLQGVQKNDQLDVGQSRTYMQLQNTLVATTKNAITQYNKMANITLLSCIGATSHPISNTSTQTEIQSAFPVSTSKGTVFWYTSGKNEKLYQLNSQYSLIDSQPDLSNITAISSTGSYLITLVAQPVKNSLIRYSLSVYQVDQTGKLGTPGTVEIEASETMSSFRPVFITSWKTSVYVVLLSAASGNQNTVRVLSYTLSSKGQLNTPREFSFSVSNTIISATAFPNQQLFLLQNNGSVLSVQVPVGNGNQQVSATNVELNASIPAPLSVSPQDFNAGTPVPVASSPGQQGIASFTVTGLSTLSSGQIGNATHLYAGDSMNHRLLDLVPYGSATSGGPTPAPSATSTGQNQTVNLQLENQFVSSQDFTQVKSIALQPGSSQLNVLTQSNAGQNLVQFNTTAQNSCAS